MELIADAGSGVPVGCLWVEKPEEDADVGLLFLPSASVKLSDLERPLSSLVPLAGLPACGCEGGRPLAKDCESAGVVLLPIGVASRNCGGVGRDEEGLEMVLRGGRLETFGSVLETGF